MHAVALLGRPPLSMHLLPLFRINMCLSHKLQSHHAVTRRVSMQHTSRGYAGPVRVGIMLLLITAAGRLLFMAGTSTGGEGAGTLVPSSSSRLAWSVLLCWLALLAPVETCSRVQRESGQQCSENSAFPASHAPHVCFIACCYL